MKTRSSLLLPLLVSTLLGLLPVSAGAAEGETVPEGCVDKSYCDGTQCFSPESSISRFVCGCGGINPVCGVGKCVEKSYCEGSGCGEEARCFAPESPVSLVMCADAEVGPECELPAGGCGPGTCEGGTYCDACGCQSPEESVSQALCGCGLADAKAGVGSCVNGGYCDGPASEAGRCYEADSAVSLAMCQGLPLVECKPQLPPAPTYCKEGSFCDAERCYELDSEISKKNCSFEEGFSMRPTGRYDIGVIAGRPGTCPVNSEYIEIYMDDEDSGNDNHYTGWVGSTRQNGAGTKLGFCRVDGSEFHPLQRTNTQDERTESYAVLSLGSACPPDSKEFVRDFDNEDTRNKNWSTGNIGSNVSNRNTRLYFCMYTPSTAGYMFRFPIFNVEYGVFAPAQLSTRYAYDKGLVHTDDEDKNNANRLMFSSAANNHQTTATAMVSAGANTDLRMARVSSLVNRCTARVYYHDGTTLPAQYDGANCYIKNVPSGGTPFVWSNNYYVTPGAGNSCSEGWYDGANCYIMSAPSGTTAFKWGNAFYYAE